MHKRKMFSELILWNVILLSFLLVKSVWSTDLSDIAMLQHRGCPHLIEHLLDMKEIKSPDELDAYIKNMSFTQVADVIIETRETILQEINLLLQNKKHKKIVFFFGDTGSGKSTTICFLRGDDMDLSTVNYFSKNDSSFIEHSPGKCGSLLPSSADLGNMVLVEIPGFSKRGQLISLGIELALVRLIKEYRPIILVLAPNNGTGGRHLSDAEKGSVKGSRNSEAAKIGDLLTRIFRDHKKNLNLCLTKSYEEAKFMRPILDQGNKNQELIKKTMHEEILSIQIDVLTNSQKGNEFDAQIINLKNQLRASQQKRMNGPFSRQKNNEKISENKLSVSQQQQQFNPEEKSNEDELCRQMGLPHKKIRFEDLTSKQHLSECLDAINEMTSVVFPENYFLDLDSKTTGLLEKAFVKSLQTEYAQFTNYKIETENSTGCAASALPKVAEFLSIPELPPIISANFDQQFLEESCKKVSSNLKFRSLHYLKNADSRKKL